MNFKLKYLKYKKKYLKLRGGEIYYDNETIDNKPLTIINESYNPETDITLMNMKEIKSELALIITSTVCNGNVFKYINNEKILNWCLDPDTVYIDPYKNTNKYFFNRYKFIIYSTPLYIIKKCKIIDEISKYIKIDNIPNNDLLGFTLYGTIFDQKINLFNSLYSTILQNMIYDKINIWLKTKTIIEPRYNPLYNSDIKKFILIKNSEAKQNKQIYFYTEQYLTGAYDRDFKIHMNVKLENIFYILDVILKNYELFENCLNQFKIDVNFPLFRVANQFSNKSSLQKVNNRYIVEEEQPPNLAFYPEIDEKFIGPFNKNKVHRNAERIINILKELFPDELNLSSNLFPRMNFRLTNCIYFSIGDSGDKFRNSEMFTAPTDYILPPRIKQMKNICHMSNKMTKLLSNHILYENNDDTNQCEDIRVQQYKLLNLKKFNDYSSRDIYKMVGQEQIYDKLRFSIFR